MSTQTGYRQTWEMVRGDTFIMTFQVKDGAIPVDLTGGSLWFTVKKRITDLDAAAVSQLTIGSGITVTDAVNGRARLTMPAAATAGLTYGKDDRVNLVWDIQFKNTSAQIFTVASGALVVLAERTLATS